MNRRLFLTYQPIFIKHNVKYLTTNPVGTNPTGTNPTGTNPAGTNPAGTKHVNANSDTVFVSSNKKLVVKTKYNDYGSFVTVVNDVSWDDPISNERMKKYVRELYILDADFM